MYKGDFNTLDKRRAAVGKKFNDFLELAKKTKPKDNKNKKKDFGRWRFLSADKYIEALEKGEEKDRLCSCIGCVTR